MTEVQEREYTVFFAFAGIGGGAIGFQQASATLAKHGLKGRFKVIGAFDFDPGAAADFELLTGVKCEVVDVRAMTPASLRALCPRRPDVVFGSAPCLPADALVVTEHGPRRIDSIRAGDRVLSHAGRYCRVRQVGTHRHVGTMVSLRTNGSPVAQSFTDEHPMWVRKPLPGQTRSRGEATFLPAAKVEVGDWIGFPIQSEVEGTARRFVESFGDPRLSERGGHHAGERYAKPRHTALLETRVRDLRAHAEDPALWFLIGAYLGDGYRRIEEGRYEVVYCLGSTQSPKAVAVRERLTALGFAWSEDRSGGDTNIKLRFHSKHLHTLLGAFGDGAESKFIPEALMTLELPLLDAFLAGYRITDGSDVAARVGETGRRYPAGWKIPSVSLPLLRGVQRLLLRMGVFGAIHRAWPGGPQEILGRTVQTKPRWEIRVQLGPRRNPGFVLEGATLWTRVQKVEHRDADEDVWNLEVDEDDTFCVHLMATHNCKGASPLLSNTLAETEKYQEMNELMLVWTRLMLAAWGEYTDEAGVRHASDLPLLIINENVPRLANRAKDVVAEVVKLLHGAGYATHAGSHNCGEVGGLAQNRVRFLLVARRHDRVPALVYQPKKQRVRGCGEVIGPLPLPSDPAGGAMHRLPDICATNCIRLALIPPGGDWRDIDGALKAHEKRREHWSRYHVARFDLTTPTVVGSGTNGAYGVADARVEAEVRKVAHNPDAHRNKYTVAGWGLWVGTIIGASHVGSGAPSIADARVPEAYALMYGVARWGDAAHTITGKSSPTCGPFSVDDLRLTTPAFRSVLGILPWGEPSHTLTSRLGPSNGAFTVADVRVPSATTYHGAYGMMPWSSPAGAITGADAPSSGRFAVADVRVRGTLRNDAYGLLTLDDPAHTVTSAEGPSTGRFTVPDPRVASAVAADHYRFTNELMLAAWHAPARTVTGATHIGNGAGAVDDVRVQADRYGMNWRVEDGARPAHTITGTKDIQAGSPSFADRRLAHALGGGGYSFTNNLMLAGWREPARTVTGAVRVGNGALSIDDLRVPHSTFYSYGVLTFAEAAPAITGNHAPGGGRFSIDDLRVPVAYGHAYGVTTWATPFGVITGHIGPSGGAFALLDVRLTCDVRENSGAYGVLDPARAAYTVTAWGDINNGRFAYADARPQAPHAARRDVVALVVGMLAPEPADYTHDAADLPAPTPAPTKARRRKVRRVAAPGARARRRGGRHALLDVLTFAADPRVPGNPELALRFPVTRLDQPPLFVPVLPTASGCWHRPLTIWERFALQSFPLYDAAGRAIVLSGNDVTAWSERVGNAVPPLTAKAVGEEFLRTLLSAEAGVFELSSGGGAWVRGKPAPEWMRVLGVLDLYPRVDERACGSLAAIEPGDPWATFVAAGTAPSTEVLQ